MELRRLTCTAMETRFGKLVLAPGQTNPSMVTAISMTFSFCVAILSFHAAKAGSVLCQ